jgi:festuclavine dehydrogenase
VSAGDIAGVAFHALTSEKPLDTTYRILGPELLTHDEVCSFSFAMTVIG